jgi:site-specific recombinase XerD
MIPVGQEDDAEVLAKYVRQEHGTMPDPKAPLFRTSGLHYPFHVGPLTAKALDYNLRLVLKRAGIKKRLTAHSFRHGFASGLLRAGANLKTVGDLLGHASLSSTERYLHTTFERKVEAVRRLRSFL